MPSRTERPVDIERHVPDRSRCPAAGQLRRARPHSPPAGNHPRRPGRPLRRQPAAAGLRRGRGGQERRRGRRRPRAARSGSSSCRCAPDGGLPTSLARWRNCGHRPRQIGDAFVRAVIVSDEPIPNLAAAAKDAAPQATFVTVEPRCAASQVAVLDRADAPRRRAGPARPVPRVPARPCTRRRGRRRHPGDLYRPARRRRPRDPGIFREEARLRAVLGDEPGQQPDRAGC